MRGPLIAFLSVILLLASALPVPATLAKAEDLVLAHADGKADAKAHVAGQATPVAFPEPETANYIDITDFSIEDPDEEYLIVRLAISGRFTPFVSGSFSSFTNQDTQHRIHFEIPGQGGAKVPAVIQINSVRLRLQNDSEVKNDFLVSRATLCILGPSQGPAPPGSSSNCDFWNGHWVHFTVEDGALRLEVPKMALTQAGQEEVRVQNALVPPRLFAADIVTGVYVLASHRLNSIFQVGGLTAEVTDRSPDAGVLQFALLHGSPAPDLRMDWSRNGVIAGTETDVLIQVTNLGTHKRIVNFTLVPLESSDEKKWGLSLTPSVTLGAGKSTNITLRVKAPELGSDYDAWTSVKIRATILTEPGTVAIEYGWLYAAHPLDRSRSTFYVHSYNFYGGLPGGIPAPFFFGGFGWGWLSRAETHEGHVDEPLAMYASNFVGGGRSSYYTRLSGDEVPNPAVFRPGEPIKSHVEFDVPFAAPANLRVLFRFGDAVLGQVEKSVALTQGVNKFDVEAVVVGTPRLDPENGSVQADFFLDFTGADAAVYAFGTAFGTEKLYLLPKVSWFNLPVDRELPAVEPTSKLKVFLSPTEDLEVFVNPGRVQVVEFDLRNEEQTTVEVGVEALNVTEDWTVDIEPGTRFRLGSNESVHIGLLIQPDASIAEGEKLRMRIVAKDIAADGLVSGHWITVLATRGVDIENETFEMRSEDAGKVQNVGGKSPPIGLLWVVAAIGLVWGRRRRA